MTELKIRLVSIDDVKDFVGVITGFNCEVDVVSGRYVVDAKSIMGLFSLDLSKPLFLKINSAEETVIEDIKDSLKQFVVD